MGAAFADAVTATTVPTHYIYRGEQLELDLDVSRVAVLYNAELAPADRLAAVGNTGIEALSDKSIGIPRWFLVDLGQTLVDARDANDQVSTLASSPQIEYASPVFVNHDGDWTIITPDILLRVESEYRELGDGLLDVLAPELELVEREFAGLEGAYKLHSGAGNGFTVLATANRLALDSRLRWAEPELTFLGRRAYIPNDPMFGQLWGIRNTGQSGGVPDMDMDGDEAWDTEMGDPGIYVLVMDDGVQQDHVDLTQLPGNDFTSDPGGSTGGPVNMCDTHGTLVAGCIGGTIDNGIGIVGISPLCPVRSARTYISTVPCDGTGTGNTGWLSNALEWGWENGCRVSNLSWTTGTSSALEDVYIELHTLGMVHTKSSGNEGASSISWPGTLDEVHAVGSVTRFGTRSGFSTYGDGLSFLAPGDDITTTARNNNYQTVDGTSFSAPYAAGVAALVIAAVPPITAAEVDQQLYDTCVDIGASGYDVQTGWGFINAAAAIDISEYYALSAELTSQYMRIGGVSEVVSFTGEVTNNGITDDVLDIAVSGIPGSWSYSYTTPAGTFSGPSTLPLTAGDTATIEIEVNSEGNPGTAVMTITAVSQGDPTKSAAFQFQKLNNAHVLIVDDDGGGSREVTLGETLGALGLIWGSWDIFNWGPLTLQDMADAGQSIIWITGDTSLSLDADERGLITDWMNDGGKIVVSGQEIAYDLADPGSPHFSPETILWFINQMHGLYTTTYSSTLFVEGVPGDMLGDGLSFGLQPTGPNAQTTPDVVNTGVGSIPSFYYQGAPTWYGGYHWTDNSAQLVFLAFGIEGVLADLTREEILSRIFDWFDIGGSSGIAGPQGAAPSFALAQNHPNPVRPSTSIRYRLDNDGPVSLRIYDVSGRLVRTLVDGPQEAMQYDVVWHGRDDDGRPVASGVYFYKLETVKESATRRLVVVR